MLLTYWLFARYRLTTRWSVFVAAGSAALIFCSSQLMAKQRTSDLGVCSSVVFRTEYVAAHMPVRLEGLPVCRRFGKEKAWGLSKFCTLEQLQKEGAYIASEDRITFGCRMVPVKNLLWGAVARSATAAAPRGIFSTP